MSSGTLVEIAIRCGKSGGWMETSRLVGAAVVSRKVTPIGESGLQGITVGAHFWFYKKDIMHYASSGNLVLRKVEV